MSWLRKRRERREQRAFEEKLQADMSAYWANATLEAARLRAPIEPEPISFAPASSRPSFDDLLFPPTPESVAVLALELEIKLADLRRLALYTIEPPIRS